MTHGAEDYGELRENLGHLARLAMTGRRQDIEVYILRLSRRYRDDCPDLSARLASLLRHRQSAHSPLRGASAAAPVDLDTRLQLVRHEYVAPFEVAPIWPASVRQGLEQIVTERRQRDDLERAGLGPTKSALFTGPPGVGKSLAARWIARELDLPLIVLDLSAVMSSFLGRTGNNLRHVLDYAKTSDCVLFLDEFDCVAKRRDDLQEVGELKRLVTVLLQEIDDWPPSKLLLAATNHGDLLDPAAWRRFELLIQFPLPNESEIRSAIRAYLGSSLEEGSAWENILSHLFGGHSFNDIERHLLRARREAVVLREPIEERFKDLLHRMATSLPQKERSQMASQLVEKGASQREAHRLTGVSRDTIRTHLKAIKPRGKEA